MERFDLHKNRRKRRRQESAGATHAPLRSEEQMLLDALNAGVLAKQPKNPDQKKGSGAPGESI